MLPNDDVEEISPEPDDANTKRGTFYQNFPHESPQEYTYDNTADEINDLDRNVYPEVRERLGPICNHSHEIYYVMDTGRETPFSDSYNQ